MENFQHAVFGDGAQRDDHLISSDGGLLEGYTLVSRSFCSFSHLIIPHFTPHKLPMTFCGFGALPWTPGVPHGENQSGA